MRYCISLLLLFAQLMGAGLRPQPVSSFMVVVQNQCGEAIHGVGFEYAVDGVEMDSILSTVPDGGWIEPGEQLEQCFLTGSSAGTWTAKVFVVSGGSAQFCTSGPITLDTQNGGVYTFVLTGTEEGGFRLQ